MHSRVLVKYILLQIPGLSLLFIALFLINKLINIPFLLMIFIVCAWIAKDILMFPKVWKAYDSKIPGQREILIGMKGTAMSDMDPEGYIKIKGELWKAEISDKSNPLKKGDIVKVNNIKENILIIEKLNL